MTEQTWVVPDEVREMKMTGKGVIFSYAIQEYESAPTEFKEFAPYIVALIDLDDGPRVTAQLTDILPHEIRGKKLIGMRVELSTRVYNHHGERGAIEYGWKFRLVDPLLGGVANGV